jgi:RNA polymerase sigma-70 factor (ECF subfamily)
MSMPSATADREQATLPAEALLAAARGGSTAALGRLFEAVRGQMLTAVRRTLPGTLQAKLGVSDIVQDAVVDAQQGFPKFAGQTPAEFFAWLRSILNRRVVDSVRRYEVAQARTVRREMRLAELNHGDPGEALAARQLPPERSVIRREDAAALERAIALLPDDCRAVIRLRHWNGQSFSEIAVAVEKSEAAVRKIWYRGLQRLGAIVREAPEFVSEEPTRSGTPVDDDEQIGLRLRKPPQRR